MSDNKEQPRAYMRKWAFDGETPYKVKNENNRLAYPKKFLFKDVTVNKVLADDVPLYAAAQPVVLTDEQIIAAFEPHIDSDPTAPHDMPTYWVRQDELIAYTRAILAAKEQA